jgi:hypothetical protein
MFQKLSNSIRIETSNKQLYPHSFIFLRLKGSCHKRIRIYKLIPSVFRKVGIHFPILRNVSPSVHTAGETLFQTVEQTV